MGSYQKSITLRKARVSNPEEIMANELSKQIASEMEKQIQEREDVEPGERKGNINGQRSV